MKIKRFAYILITLFITATIIIAATSYRVDNYFRKLIYTNNSSITKLSNNYSAEQFSFNMENSNLFAEFVTLFGRRTICEVSAKEKGVLKISFDSYIEKGNLKVVFVSSDRNVVTIFEQNKVDDCTIEVPKGNSSIKIIADNAVGKFKMSFKIDENINIAMP